MKKILVTCTLIGLIITGCKSEKKIEAQDQQLAAVTDGTSYVADIDSSTVAWKGSHIGGIAPHNGTVKLKNGTLFIKNDEVVGGKFMIDLATVENVDLAGEPEMQQKLINHIKSAEILHSEKFPTATFEITSIEKSEGNFNTKITGNLTFLGNTKSITFPANVSNTGGQVTVDSDLFIIDRTQWGLDYGTKSKEEIAKMDEKAQSKVLSNDVEFQVKVIAKK